MLHGIILPYQLRFARLKRGLQRFPLLSRLLINFTMPDKAGTDEHVKDATVLSRGTRNKSSYTKHTKHRPHASKWVLLRQLPDHDKKLGKFLLRKSDAKFHCTDGDGSDSMIQRGVANLEPSSLVRELPELSPDHIADSYPAPITEFTPEEQCLANTPDLSVAAELGEETQVPYEQSETCMLEDAPPCCLWDYLTSVESQLTQGEEDGPKSD